MNKANCFELFLNDYIVLISYKTPVAYFDRKSKTYYRTDKFFSTTTSRHINKWLDSRNADLPLNCNQDFLDNLIQIQEVQ